MTPLTTDIVTTVVDGKQIDARVYRDPQGVAVAAYDVDTGQLVPSLIDPVHDLLLALMASLIDARASVAEAHRLRSTLARAATDPRPAHPNG